MPTLYRVSSKFLYPDKVIDDLRKELRQMRTQCWKYKMAMLELANTLSISEDEIWYPPDDAFDKWKE